MPEEKKLCTLTLTVSGLDRRLVAKKYSALHELIQTWEHYDSSVRIEPSILPGSSTIPLTECQRHRLKTLTETLDPWQYAEILDLLAYTGIAVEELRQPHPSIKKSQPGAANTSTDACNQT